MTTKQWRHLPFEEAVSSRGSGSYGLSQKEWVEQGAYPVIGQGEGQPEGWTNRQDLVIDPKPALVLYGGHTRRTKIVYEPFVPGPNVKILSPIPELDPRFLYYYLSWLPIDSKGYADHFPLVRKSTICFPGIAEQLRIVDILDEALAGIAIAKANAEKNLRNVRDLFACVLHTMFTGKGWDSVTLNVISENLDSRRVPITKGDRKAGNYPYYGASGIVDYVDDYIFDHDALLVSEDGANLLARSTPIAFSVSGKYWVNNHAHILRFDDMATQRFVEFYLESIPLDEYVTGAAQPKLNQKALNSIPIPMPSTNKDRAMAVRQIEGVQAEVKHLQSLTTRKLAALDELKHSLLQRAFSGQLT